MLKTLEAADIEILIIVTDDDSDELEATESQ